MKLAPNWKRIVRYSQSFWINVIASLLGSLALGFHFLFGIIPLDPITFIIIMVLLDLAAVVFRLVFQKKLSN